MKKMNKKGFTIVELVIVIAVIAILSAVLIPTFSNVIANANKTAALQEARNNYTEYVAEAAAKGDVAVNVFVEVKGGWVIVKDAQVQDYDVYKTLKEAKEAKVKEGNSEVAIIADPTKATVLCKDHDLNSDEVCKDCGYCKSHVDEKDANGDPNPDKKCDKCGAAM